MIRVVLAVVLGTALVGASLPAAERAERDRNAALATDELNVLATDAERLAARNDPVDANASPATTTVTLRPPEPSFTDGGRFHVADGRLVWVPARGPNVSVRSEVPIRVDGSLRIESRTELRLSLSRTDGQAVVRVRRAGIQKESRDQPPYAG
ncbi:hypothetical protein HWV23_11325 [Natronomonas halophila]|uniref:DUF7311 family protein n=1 Tax=Natronomonas halophila TaxID=2747817 RepID=UPI0015B5E737|nr:hypothetical protein [Natronomonas halophila]QLD86288.1 hypothetical protein HWV23_11325 [Natronomonas halophila]